MAELLVTDKPLPVGSSGERSAGWWGVWTLIVTEGSLFGYLLVTYFYLGLQVQEPWPPEGMPKLLVPAINTVILLSSSVFVWLAEYHLKHERRRASICMMAISILLGAIFVAVQMKEWGAKPYGITSSLYGSLYFTITGFHMAHVVVGLIILCLLLLWIALGLTTKQRLMRLRIGGLYWHFVDAVWLVIFSSLYLFPYLSGR